MHPRNISQILLIGSVIMTEDQRFRFVSFIIYQSISKALNRNFSGTSPSTWCQEEIQKICKTLPFPENDKNWLRGWIKSHEKEQQQKKLKYRKRLHMKVFVESFIHLFIHSGVLTRKAQNGHYQEGKISKIIVRFHGDCELCSDPWKLKRTWIN